ncbi:MAG TPA: NAD-dependent epimerase/dehydratase family protein [Planctomycetota bacterium]|nr:NAD-dependent epimerase/dehydratase family protein [Planctomycetota bacterium]
MTDAGKIAGASEGDLKPGSPVLVTGGAGFIGRRVVQLLSKAGHSVRRLDLPAALQATPGPALRAGDAGGDVACDLADPNCAAALDSALKGVRTIVHLAGILQDGEHTVEAVNLEGSLKLIAACERSDVRRFVYLSSSGAATGRSRYLNACLAVEEALQEQTRMEEMILRCSPVFGVGDHLLTPIIKLFKSKKWAIPCLQNGWQTFNPIFVDDVASIIGKLVGDEKAQPNIWTLGGTQPVALIDMMTMVQDATHRVKCILHTPPFLTMLALPLSNLLWPEARMSMDLANTIAKDTLLVDGEENQTQGLLQSLPTSLESELARVVEGTV